MMTGKRELRDLAGTDDGIQPGARHLDAFADLRILEDGLAERNAGAGLQQTRAHFMRNRPLAEEVPGFLLLACRDDAKPVAEGRLRPVPSDLSA